MAHPSLLPDPTTSPVPKRGQRWAKEPEAALIWAGNKGSDKGFPSPMGVGGCPLGQGFSLTLCQWKQGALSRLDLQPELGL